MTTGNRFRKLLEPGFIGRIRTRNRLVKVGAGTSFVDKGGFIGETIKDFYAALARGGVGLIIVESCGVDYPSGIHHLPVQLHLERDEFIPGYSQLTETIHKYQCPAFLQLFHSGPWHPSKITGLMPIAASELTPDQLQELGADPVKGLTLTEIEELVDKFAKAAVRAQKAGFDGVEINANSSHLINTFLSPIWNRRDDKYGPADLTSRSRFLTDIIKETRQRTGPDFALSVLLTGAEFGVAGGITVSESGDFGRISQQAGADAVQVRGFGYQQAGILHPGPERFLFPEPPGHLISELDWSRHGAGAFVPLAAAVKKKVSIPVITVGRLDPVLGEKVLEEGKADFIGMHRRLLADPELPNKVAEGRLDDIAPCTACYYCWHERINDRYIKCRINASLGREREYAIRPAEKKKKVLVAGGGPAGMEAARVAALRGHQVYLYDRGPRLGGLLPLAGVVKGFEVEDLMCIVNYLSHQIRKLDVTVKLSTEVTPALVKNLQPDAVILATGGVDVVPQIPGIDNRKVVLSSALHHKLKIFLRFIDPPTLRKLTRFWMPLGKECVIIGGGIHGCQLAEFLTGRNRKVTILETGENIGEGIVPSDTRRRLLSWLKEKGVIILSGVKYEEINDWGVVITTREGEKKTIPAGNIIPALPMKPSAELLAEVSKQVAEVYQIGDCREPLLTADAVADGARIGHKI